MWSRQTPSMRAGCEHCTNHLWVHLGSLIFLLRRWCPAGETLLRFKNANSSFDSHNRPVKHDKCGEGEAQRMRCPTPLVNAKVLLNIPHLEGRLARVLARNVLVELDLVGSAEESLPASHALQSATAAGTGPSKQNIPLKRTWAQVLCIRELCRHMIVGDTC